MFKKLLFIFLAGVILVTLLVTDAAARCSLRLARLGCSDLSLEICASGLKNEDVITVVCAASHIADASVEAFTNPAGGANTEPASSNFDGAVLDGSIEAVATEDFIGPGNACLEYTLYTWIDDVYPAIARALGAPNDSWIPVGLYIGDMRTYVGLYQEDKKTGQMVPSGSAECITGTADGEVDFDSTCSTEYLANALFFETQPNLDECLSVPEAEYNLRIICDNAIDELYNQ